MTDFKTYYKNHFRYDLLKFCEQIPIESPHYNNEIFNIQYFFLTPNCKCLDVIPTERQGLFAVALFWTVLIDQVFYTHFRLHYQTFQQNTMYPKFIGNCMTMCRHNQHPKKILQAINDVFDKGYTINTDFFKRDKNQTKRERIQYFDTLEQSKDVMKEEIKDYFQTHQPEIKWTEFFAKCEEEL